MLKILDQDFYDSLDKAEIYKQNSKTALDPEEMRIGLQIVPKTVLKFFSTMLTPMKPNENKDISLDFVAGVGNRLQVTKQDLDVYSGEVYKDGQVVTSFKYRSLPGVALVIMSCFELYDEDNLTLAQIGPAEDESFKEKSKMLDKLIEDRVNLICLVDSVIEKKMSAKNAIQALLLERLAQKAIESKPEVKNKPEAEVIVLPEALVEKKEGEMKPLKLKEFLDKKKQKKKNFECQISKAEANCPYCSQSLFTKSGFSGCVCLGEDAENKVFIAKTEKGVKISFHKSWDPENIQMVLEALKTKN